MKRYRIIKGFAILIIFCWLIFQMVILELDARTCMLNDDIKALCVKYGKEYDIDEYLIMAFCEVESHGKANVVSANGQYIGLMQLNKDTFSGDLTDPENNIKQGVAYLDYLRSKNDENMKIAVSYYSGESGKIGFYTMKVLNRYFELYCLSIGKEEKCI